MAVTGQGYGRFHFIEPPLTCVTFMTCYITFKLPFFPAFFGEHDCFSTVRPHLYWAHYIFLGTKYFCHLFDNFID